MSVVGVTELPQTSGGIDERGIRHFTRNFLVEVNSLSDGPKVASSVGIPGLYAPYIIGNEADHGCIVQHIDPVRRADHFYLWDVKVEYSSAPIPHATGTAGQPSDQNNQQQTPELRPPEWKVKGKRVDKVVTRCPMKIGDGGAIADRDVLNTAGVRFENPLTVPSSNALITVTASRRNVAFYQDCGYWFDTINETVWQGFPSLSLRVEDVEVGTKFENGILYWTRSVTVEYKPDGWHPVKIQNLSTVELYYPDPADKTKKALRNIKDSHGADITHGVPINEAGERLAFGKPIIYLYAYPYVVRDFSNLI